MPFANINLSAATLDSRRLNKQLLEGGQIYRILATNKTKGGWVRHPAVLMWKNYDMGLFAYLEGIKNECIHRGIQTEKNWNTILDLHKNNWHRGDKVVMPGWWGDEQVHLSHRQNLYNKDPDYYAFFADDNRLSAVSCCDKCNYFWPTHTLMYNGELIEPFQYVR